MCTIVFLLSMFSCFDLEAFSVSGSMHSFYGGSIFLFGVQMSSLDLIPYFLFIRVVVSS